MAKLRKILLGLSSLLPVLSPNRFFAVGLQAFHFGVAYAPGEAETDVAAGEGALTY